MIPNSLKMLVAYVSTNPSIFRGFMKDSRFHISPQISKFLGHLFGNSSIIIPDLETFNFEGPWNGPNVSMPGFN